MKSPTLRWYVVHCKPREESRAQYFLGKKSVHSYLPLMEMAIVRGSRIVNTEKPLFPGYLFCRFDPKTSLAWVQWTQGVIRILPHSSSPFPVKDEAIAAIQSLEQKDGVIRKSSLNKHDRIRIARGPMKDILGVFEHWTSDQGRVRVLLNFVNYQVSVQLHYSYVEKVA